jgi:hypothetical protein
LSIIQQQANLARIQGLIDERKIILDSLSQKNKQKATTAEEWKAQGRTDWITMQNTVTLEIEAAQKRINEIDNTIDTLSKEADAKAISESTSTQNTESLGGSVDRRVDANFIFSQLFGDYSRLAILIFFAILAIGMEATMALMLLPPDKDIMKKLNADKAEVKEAEVEVQTVVEEQPVVVQAKAKRKYTRKPKAEVVEKEVEQPKEVPPRVDKRTSVKSTDSIKSLFIKYVDHLFMNDGKIELKNPVKVLEELNGEVDETMSSYFIDKLLTTKGSSGNNLIEKNSNGQLIPNYTQSYIKTFILKGVK